MWSRAVDCGEIPAYPLRTWLSGMQPSADRGNARGRKLGTHNQPAGARAEYRWRPAGNWPAARAADVSRWSARAGQASVVAELQEEERYGGGPARRLKLNRDMHHGPFGDVAGFSRPASGNRFS
jgi:hypothetical protein